MSVQPQQPASKLSTPVPADRPAAPEVSIGELAKDASTHLSTIIRGEVELAKTEIRGSVKNAGAGVVMFIAAGVVLAFSLTFALIALAEGIHAAGIWRWASYLIVFGFLVLLAVIFVYIGVKKVKKVKAPQRTIATTKDTAAFLKHPTKA